MSVQRSLVSILMYLTMICLALKKWSADGLHPGWWSIMKLTVTDRCQRQTQHCLPAQLNNSFLEITFFSKTSTFRMAKGRSMTQIYLTLSIFQKQENYNVSITIPTLVLILNYPQCLNMN